MNTEACVKPDLRSVIEQTGLTQTLGEEGLAGNLLTHCMLGCLWLRNVEVTDVQIITFSMTRIFL